MKKNKKIDSRTAATTAATMFPLRIQRFIA